MTKLNQDTFENPGITSAPSRRSFDIAGHVATLLSGFAPRTVAYMAMAAVVGLLAQAVAVSTFFIQGQDQVQVGKDFGLASAATGETPLLVVRFSPQATSTDISKFLVNHKAEVVAGPRRGNFYDVRVVGLPSKAQIATVVKQMQHEPEIVDLVAEKE